MDKYQKKKMKEIKKIMRIDRKHYRPDIDAPPRRAILSQECSHKVESIFVEIIKEDINKLNNLCNLMKSNISFDDGKIIYHSESNFYRTFIRKNYETENKEKLKEKLLYYYNQYVDILINNNFQQLNDGYHTFDELYNHRMMLFSVICESYKESAWKSKLHDDGTMYKDYFIVGITTPQGNFTYHYHIDNWNNFDIEELKKAPKWDGHTPNDIVRLKSLI